MLVMVVSVVEPTDVTPVPKRWAVLGRPVLSECFRGLGKNPILTGLRFRA